MQKQKRGKLKKCHHGDQHNSSPTFSFEQHITVGFKGLTPNQKSVMNLEMIHKICTMNRNYFKFLHIYLNQESDLIQFGSFVWDIFFDPSTEAAFRWQPGWHDHLIRVVLVQINTAVPQFSSRPLLSTTADQKVVKASEDRLCGRETFLDPNHH